MGEWLVWSHFGDAEDHERRAQEARWRASATAIYKDALRGGTIYAKSRLAEARAIRVARSNFGAIDSGWYR